MKALHLSFLIILCFLNSRSLYSRNFTTDTDATVLHKHYPKKYRVEILPTATMLLNQSYISTYFIGGQLSFYPSEAFGLHLEGSFGFNQDLPSRHCLETFYNDPSTKKELKYVCGYNLLQEKGIVQTNSPEARKAIGDHILAQNATLASLGPAYVPIRELSMLIALTASWNIIYGKQLAFMKFTNYFDLYLKFGGGLALSNYYPAQIAVKGGDGRKYRTHSVQSNTTPTECDKSYGVCVSGTNKAANWEDLIGTAGRPEAQKEISPLVTTALGYRFHFLKRLHLSTEIRSYLLIGTQKNREVKENSDQTSTFVQYFEHSFMISGGLGFRI